MQSSYRDLIKLYADREYNGKMISLGNVSHSRIRSLEVMGETVEVGEEDKSPDNPFELVGSTNPILKIGEQSVTIQYTLNGIPVASGGNYIDENGQQWICDTYNPLTGEYIQRVGKYEITGNENITSKGKNNSGYIYTILNAINDYDNHNINLRAMCSHYNFIKTYDSTDKALITMKLNEVSIYAHLVANYWTIYFNVGYDNADSFKSYLQEQYKKGTPVMIYYEIAQPIANTLESSNIYANIPNTNILLDEINNLGSIKTTLQTKE